VGARGERREASEHSPKVLLPHLCWRKERREILYYFLEKV